MKYSILTGKTMVCMTAGIAGECGDSNMTNYLDAALRVVDAAREQAAAIHACAADTDQSGFSPAVGRLIDSSAALVSALAEWGD